MSIRSQEKVDRTGFAEEEIAKARAALEVSGNLDDPAVVEALLQCEKKCRLSNDAIATKNVCVAILKLCREKQSWSHLIANSQLLAKRRSQSKVAITGIVAQGLEQLEDTTIKLDDATREELLKTLCDVTDGKMYCEAERAKLTRMLSALKERQGDVAAAADILQDVNVETYGALSKREKVDYILDQVRLMLAKGDRVRAYILSKKVQRKTLEEDDLQDLKVRFYKLMSEYHVLEDAPFDLAQNFWSIFNTKTVQDDEASWRDALSSTALFLALSQHAPGVSDMMHRVLADNVAAPKLEKLPTAKHLLTLFTTQEIVAYPLTEEHQRAVEAHPALHTAGPEIHARWKNTLRERVIQHNIRVVSGYYRQLSMARLANLLGLSVDEAEKHVSDMVSDSGLYAKIDRPKGIIVFAKPQGPDEVLQDWASDISKMLSLVETTCYLINKETMMHKKALEA
jgi:26S proteasome regulatory subunit N5